MKISFLDAAQSEFDKAIDYYEEQRSGLGFEFAEEVKQTLERISHYPEAWSPISPRVRRCLLNRFPYSVMYEVRLDIFIIIAIQNNHRRPNSWRSRIK